MLSVVKQVIRHLLSPGVPVVPLLGYLVFEVGERIGQARVPTAMYPLLDNE